MAIEPSGEDSCDVTVGDGVLVRPGGSAKIGSWQSIQIELIGGGGQTLWPRPGRIFAAARSHTFAQLATAIDDAFARWDRAHLHMFDLSEHGGLLIDRYWDDPPERARLDETARLGTLAAGQQFVYVFDLGDDWAHLCTVADQRIDPQDALGITPDRPLPYWGWGFIPDQYGRRWNGDDGETRQPANPQLTDLPALHPGWGPRHRSRGSSCGTQFSSEPLG